MKKPADLRAYLTDAVPHLQRHPDKLHIFIERGAIACRLTGLSFEYRYDLELVFLDFADHADTLIIPLLAWLATNQPSLLLHPEKSAEAVRFEAEIIDHEKTDIKLTLALTEAVVVAAQEGGYTATHIPEPPLPDLGGPIDWQIFLNGVLVGTGT